MAEHNSDPTQDTSYQIMRIFDEAIGKQRSQMNEAIEAFIRSFSASGGYNMTKAQAVSGLGSLGSQLIEINQKAMHELSITAPKIIRGLYSGVEDALQEQIATLQGQIAQAEENRWQKITELQQDNEQLIEKLKTVADQTEKLLQHVDTQSKVIQEKEKELSTIRSDYKANLETIQTERQMERLVDEKEIQDLKSTVKLLEETRQETHEAKEEEDDKPLKADEEAIKKTISLLDNDDDDDE